MPHRLQFTVKTLLWLMAVVAAFLGGIEWDRRHADDDRADLLSRLQASRAHEAKLTSILYKHGIHIRERKSLDETE